MHTLVFKFPVVHVSSLYCASTSRCFKHLCFFKAWVVFFIVVAAKPSKGLLACAFSQCVCCFFEAHQLLKGVRVIKKECREHSVWGFLVAKNAKTHSACYQSVEAHLYERLHGNWNPNLVPAEHHENKKPYTIYAQVQQIQGDCMSRPTKCAIWI